MPKIIINERVFIPKIMVKISRLRQYYSIPLYNDSACNRCNIFKDGLRHSKDDCDNCINFKGNVKLWNKIKINNKTYYGLPNGRLKQLERQLNLSLKDAKDLRPIIPLSHPIKFVRPLYTGKIVDGRPTVDQEAIVEKWLNKKTGIINLPPRSGKCVVGSTLIHTNSGTIPIKNLFDKNHKSGYWKYIYNTKILTMSGYKNVSSIYKERVKSTIKITTEDRNSIRCRKEHPILILKENLKLDWVKAENIKEGDYICYSNQPNFKYGNTVRSDLSRILGYVIANAHTIRYKTHGTSFTSNNLLVQKDYISCWESLFGRNPVFKSYNKKAKECKINKSELDQLENYGLNLVKSAKKSIPDIIMQADKNTIIEFISAYISCDSYLIGNELELCSASKILIKQLQILLMRFNIHGRMNTYTSYARNTAKNINSATKIYHSLYFNSAAKTRIIEIFKPLKPSYQRPINNGKYLVEGIPYIRQCMQKFVDTYSLGLGWFLYKGKKIRFKIPFCATKDKNLVSRQAYKEVNWNKIYKFIKAFDRSTAENIKLLSKTNYIFKKVINKKIINKYINVYDVNVTSNHSFVTNGMISHNSAVATKIVCELGVKTLIVANQDRHLRQFIRSFKGAPGYAAFTNIEQVEKKLGRPLIGIVEKVSDFAKLDIACMTYQKLIRKDAQKKINKWLANNRTLLIVDECHQMAALRYGQFISRLNCRYKLGLSATVERKDGTSIITKEHLGDVVAKSNIIGLAPKIEIVETGIVSKYDYKSWMPAMAFLANNIDRKRLIVREVFKDLSDSHSIIIAVDLVKQVNELVHLINTTAAYQNENFDKTWPDVVAKPYVRTNLQKKRSNTNDEMAAVLDDFDNGKFKVLVAMRSMIKENIDLASPTRLYMLVPTSASSAHTDLEPSGKIGSPNFQQLAFRISTFALGKPQPVVKIFVDGIPQSYRCFSSLFWHEILPNLRKYENAPPRYKMDEITLQRAMQLAKDYNYVPHNAPGKFISSKKAIKLSRRKVVGATKPGFQPMKKSNQVRSYEKYHLV